MTNSYEICSPVGVGVGSEMRCEGAGRAAELAEELRVVDLPLDTLEAVDEDGELLAHRGGRRRLAVGAREHGVVAVLACLRLQFPDDGAELRQPHPVDRGTHRERVRQVVDVLARRREMRELGDVVESQSVEAFADEVFDGLHVVLRGRFELGEPVDLGLPEIVGQRPQRGGLLCCERRRPEHPVTRQVDQPLDFDLHAGAVQPRLREVIAEADHRGTVAAVERAERLGRQGGHGAPCERDDVPILPQFASAPPRVSDRA